MRYQAALLSTTSISCKQISNFSPFKRLTLFLLFTILTGCQHLRFPDFDFASGRTAKPAPTIETLESHNFRIDPNSDLVGLPAVMISEAGDTLPDIARHYGLGFNDISHANPDLDIWVPKSNTRVVLPIQFVLPESRRRGIVLNLANMRLFYFPKGDKTLENRVMTYPIGIGRQGWSTPTGKARIVQKKANPTWTVPASILREHKLNGDPLPRVVKAGPDNPLGQYAMRLSIPSYLIHGTNKPYGVGMRISHGCVRLYPENIEHLFKHVSVGTDVIIVNEPYLVGWWRNMLYIEAHKPLDESKKSKAILKRALIQKLKKEAEKTITEIDWEKIDATIDQARGIPTPILKYTHSLEDLTKHWDIIANPAQFYGKPPVPPIGRYDWSAIANIFNNEIDARRMAEILTHQGPSIPARVSQSNGQYQVIVGPYKTQKDMEKAKRRLSREFEIDARIIQPII